MKTKSPLFRIALLATAAMVFQARAAEFKGSDPLTRDSGNWSDLFPDSDRNRLVFREGDGLVYRTRSKSEYRFAFLKWTPAKARADEDWFAQVTVNLNGEDQAMAGLAILNAENRDQGYLISIIGDEDFANIRAQNMDGREGRFSRGSIDRATLRLHYTSRTRMITPSWNTRGVWRFLKPFDASRWSVRTGEAFHIVLLGRQPFTDEDEENASSPAKAAKADGDVFFRNFRCGPAEPWMTVENSGRMPLSHPVARLGFGRAAVDGPGRTMTVVLRNEGTAPLVGIRLRKSGDPDRHFHLLSLPGTVLKPGATMPFEIRFHPSETGIHQALVTVESNDPRRLPQKIRISGVGEPRK